MKLEQESKPRENRAAEGNETHGGARRIVLMNLGFWCSVFQYSVFTTFSLPFFLTLIKGEGGMHRKNETGAFKEAPPTTSSLTCA
jgi:hypothetical protein